MKIKRLLLKKGEDSVFRWASIGTCKMKSAQWRKRRDGPPKGVGGHGGSGRACESKTGWFVFLADQLKDILPTHPPQNKTRKMSWQCNRGGKRQKQGFAERWPRLIALWKVAALGLWWDKHVHRSQHGCLWETSSVTCQASISPCPSSVTYEVSFRDVLWESEVDERLRLHVLVVLKML